MSFSNSTFCPSSSSAENFSGNFSVKDYFNNYNNWGKSDSSSNTLTSIYYFLSSSGSSSFSGSSGSSSSSGSSGSLRSVGTSSGGSYTPNFNNIGASAVTSNAGFLY